MQNLENQIKIKLTEFHKIRIEQIDNFDYSNLVWKMKQENGMSEDYINKGIENLKRYYVVALLDPLNEHAVSELVDPFWHTHILFTKEYNKFCKDIFKGYIHHTPLNQSDASEVEKVSKLYEYTIETYNNIFYEVDKKWWPKLGENAELKTIVRPVCLHMLIHDHKIQENALFQKNIC